MAVIEGGGAVHTLVLLHNLDYGEPIYATLPTYNHLADIRANPFDHVDKMKKLTTREWRQRFLAEVEAHLIDFPVEARLDHPATISAPMTSDILRSNESAKVLYVLNSLVDEDCIKVRDRVTSTPIRDWVSLLPEFKPMAKEDQRTASERSLARFLEEMNSGPDGAARGVAVVAG